MDPKTVDPFQPRPATPPPSPTDQAGQYAPMVNPGNQQPPTQADNNNVYSDQQAVDWARLKIASLHPQPTNTENPVQDQLVQSQTPAAFQPAPLPPSQPPPTPKVPAYMPKQPFATFELPEEEAAAEQPVAAAPQPEPEPVASTQTQSVKPPEIDLSNQYEPLENAGAPIEETPLPSGQAAARHAETLGTAAVSSVSVTQPIASSAPTPESTSWWSKLKNFYAGRPMLPSRIKPFVTSALVGVGIFFLFNSQVLIGQIQYITNTGSDTSAAPVDIAADEVVGPEPVVIIPKINVNVPVVYDVNTYDESTIQQALERGVVHYYNTALPGQAGNNVIVGHSSNNWWSSGKYKFAFVLLNKLEVGDTFVLHYDSKKYIYEVSEKKIVEPTDLSVVQPTPEPTVTLITCDPPGTALRRLAVSAKQISPNPNQINQSGGQAITENQIESPLPGNTPSLWQQIRGLFSN